MTRTAITIDAAGGEYMEAVLLLEWLVKPGEKVAAGQHICTVETAKAATEITAEAAGWIAEILVPEGEESPVGAPLGWISDVEGETTAATATASASPAASVPSPAAAAPAKPIAESPTPGAMLAPEATSGRIIASPLARRLAKDAGIALDSLQGSGPRGRIKRRDVEAALEASAAAAQTPPAAVTAAPREATLAPVAGHIASAPSQIAALGRRAPLVLLHGFGADRTAFAALRASLPPEIEVIALDLPGHGREGQTRALSIEAVAEVIADRLDALQFEEIHLAGHSLGGAAALALAASGRVVVRSLTLLAPGGLGVEVNAGFISALVEAQTPEALEPWLRSMVADPAILPPGLARGMIRQAQSENLSEMRRVMAAGLFPGGAQGFDLRGALSRLTCPTRVIWGREDRVIPVSQAMNLPAEVALHLLPGVGHVPQMEAPALCARLIAQTIRSAGA